MTANHVERGIATFPRITGSGGRLGVNYFWSRAVSTPEVLEPMRCQLGVAHRVLDVFATKPAAPVWGIAAAVSQHMRMDCGWIGNGIWAGQLKSLNRLRAEALATLPLPVRWMVRCGPYPTAGPRGPLDRVAQIADRKYCRSDARPFRLGFPRKVPVFPICPPAAL